MGIERIECANDPRVDAYRGVRDAELMRVRGLFVAEGRLVVRRAIDDSRYKIASVLVNDAALRDMASAFQSLEVDVPVFVCSGEALAGIAGYDVHRGCLALVHRPPAKTIDKVVRAATQTLVVLEAVSNADNVGSVFRNAASFGVSGVLLSPTCCDPLYRKAIRTSMGAVLHMPFARTAADEWPLVLARLRGAGFTLVALTPREPSETLDVFVARPRPARVALIVGTEGAGLSTAVESMADHRVRIPISSGVDSLNLATAVGVALYALR
jgi:tRNA G18 (ribose-2'-O)-methylase SpoU